MRVLRVLIFAFAVFLSVNEILDRVSGMEILQVESPDDVVRELEVLHVGDQIPHTPALFGLPDYFLEHRGTLVYVPKAEGEGFSRKACTTINPANSSYWRSLFPESTEIGESLSKAVVLLVDRGGCSFTQKIRNAQAALNGHVVSVLVANNEDPADGLPYMQDDGHGKDVQLPSLLIGKHDATILKEALRKRENDSRLPPIIVHVQYSVPNPDGRVEYELWTSSADDRSASFKTAFGEVARQLGQAAVFTPHYFTVNGTEWGCEAESNPCGNQCVTGGKYCAADPQKDVDVGYAGKDIVYENIRQLCLWKYIQPDIDVDTGKSVVVDDGQRPFDQPLVWFDYVERLAKYCADPSSWQDESCSFKVLESLDSTVPQLSMKVKSCFVAAQNNISLTPPQPVTLLDIEIAEQVKLGIFVLPQAFVNKRPYFGSLNCPSPLRPATCGLLSMICAGYSSQPELCQVLLENNTPTSSGSSIGAVIGIGIAFGVVAGIAVYLYMKKQNMAMRDDDSLLQQFLPFEGGGVAGLEPGSKHNSTNGNGTHSISLGSVTS